MMIFARRQPSMLLRLGIVLAASVVYGAGCGHSARTSKPAATSTVLDYRNGWYHTADGRQSVAEISRQYQRDARLVAQLNTLSPASVAPKGKMLYIRPSNDRQYVRATLVRIQASPSWCRRFRGAPSWSPRRSRPRSRPARHPKENRGGQENRHRPQKRRRQGRRRRRPRRANGTGRPELDASLQVRRAFHLARPGRDRDAFRDGWNKACHGLEISVPEGSPVVAARDGKVLWAREMPGYGNMILIDHLDGIYVSVYGYNARLLVHEQDKVHAGEKIAMAGHSRTSDSGMLFFQIRRNGQAIDPLDFLE